MSGGQKAALAINASILAEATFKANQNYELVLFDRLPPAQQEMLADLQKQPNFYGILRPAESSGLSIKSVSQDTALLYLTLREPGRLPSYARATAGDQYEAVIAKLVLDQILEIEDEGEFVSGAQAYNLLCGAAGASEAHSRIGQLSIAALQYGQALAISDITELSVRLYNYQRIPISPRWRRRFPTTEKVAELLGVDAGGRHQPLLAECWQLTPQPNAAPTAQRPNGRSDAAAGTLSADAASGFLPLDSSPQAEAEHFAGWLAWNARRARGAPRPSAQSAGSTHKLYVSPLPDFIIEAFDITLRTLSDTAAFHLKVGGDLEGLLRPDKLVAYFSSFEDLQAAAQLLGDRLAGCPAHGVPFTAEIAGDGLLSWGVDPPESQQLLSWQPRESWRLWLTNRLANALLAAKNAPRANGANRLEPWQYALQRLRLEGIDTDLWTPAPQIWQ